MHGGGIDKPLGLVRMDYSYTFPNPVLIVPHANWRGTYETSTFSDRYADRCKTVWLPQDEVVYQDTTGHMVMTADASPGDIQQTRCIERDFPGAYMGMDHQLKRQTVSGPIAWHGSLVMDGQDASGLSYRRNRYYDANSGRFTQEDPAGIAGGLNVYGFANGDPVSYSDPYGLAALNCCKLQDVADAAAGFGDAASFGLSGFVRRHTPGGDGVDYESGAYLAGGVAGTAAAMIATDGGSELASAGEGGVKAATAVTEAAPAAESASRAAASRITGYTKHGLNQAISRDGVGVGVRAIRDAVASPIRTAAQSGGRMKYIGENATVILSEAGKVITTWARNASGWRIIP